VIELRRIFCETNQTRFCKRLSKLKAYARVFRGTPEVGELRSRLILKKKKKKKKFIQSRMGDRAWD
jgi:hypothetical protein